MHTDQWGIDEGYNDVSGQWHPTSEATRRSLRVAMGGLPDVDDPPPHSRPVWFVTEGDAPNLWRPADLHLEDGTALAEVSSLPPDLPLGYHALQPDDGGPSTHLIVVPRACPPAKPHSWGWAVQLYATRSRQSWGIGDLRDLATFGQWATGQGASVVAVNPLHAPLPLPEQQASPYYPSSRRFRNPLYLRIEDVPGWSRVADDPEVAEAVRAGKALLQQRRIDRDRVHAAKQVALGKLFEAFVEDPDFDAFETAGGDELYYYAVFCALAEHHGSGWHRWPQDQRRPELPAVERFAAANEARVRYHMWLQWLLDRQLSDVAQGVSLLGDLAVGVDPDGADAWVWQDTFAHGVRVGAPPDSFSPTGQDWGLPPWIPWRLRAEGYGPFASTLRSAFRHCSALRIDHVMGLFRLYWIPEGAADATEGAYVRYPGTELLDIVSLEATRAGAYVVGEDLGTVEEQVREQLASRDVLSYKLVWFESDPPERYPERALAAVTTHDLPTVAGVWTGEDRRALESIGMASAAGDHLRAKLAELTGATDPTPVEEVVSATYARLARAPSALVVATVEDALCVPERPNVPGTTDQWPNWSIALPESLEDVLADPRATQLAATLDLRDHHAEPPG